MPQFRHLPVSSLTDVTHNFEQLQSEAEEQARITAANASHIRMGAGEAKWAAKGFVGTAVIKTGIPLKAFVCIPLATEPGATIQVSEVKAGSEAKVEVKTPSEHAEATVAFFYWIATS